MYKVDPATFGISTIFEFSDIGNTVLYWPISFRLKRGGDFAISVHITEIANVRRGSDDARLWEYITKDQNGNIVRNLSKPWPEDLPPIVSQFLWIDEPVGHALQIDGGLFLTPQECYSRMKPSPKGGKRRLLRSYRNRYLREMAAEIGITVTAFLRCYPDLDYNSRRKSIFTR